MKCRLGLAVLFASLTLVNSATARDLSNKFAVVVRGGYHHPSDVPDTIIETKGGRAVNLGLLYGCKSPDDELAFEVDATYSEFDAEAGGFKIGDFQTLDIGIGVQYRFITDNFSGFSPYLGLGVDFLSTDFHNPRNFSLEEQEIAENITVESTYGGHVKLGTDIFLSKHIALNVEAKGVKAAKADVKYLGLTILEYDPSYLAALLGIRYFF